jgi:cytochrome P450
MTEQDSAPVSSLVNPEFFHDPYPGYERLRERGVTRLVMENGSAMWFVTRYSEARAVLTDSRMRKDPRYFEDPLAGNAADQEGSDPTQELLSRHMLNSDPPEHTRLRKLVSKAFTRQPTVNLRPLLERVVTELLDGFTEGQKVDLIESYAVPVTTTVICEMIGVPHQDAEMFHEWYNIMTGVSAPEQAKQARHHLVDYLTGLIDDRRRSPREDMISALVQASEDADRLSQTEVLSMLFLLLGAGHETTISLIGNGILALLRHPGQAAVLRADPSLMPKAVEELLRYDSPLGVATFRYTTEPVEVGGVTIPANESVFVAFGSANRDPEKFDRPDDLDVRRAAGHIAFGHGIHHCLGAPLARMEGEVAIGSFIRRFPDARLAVDPDELAWRMSVMIRGLAGLPVVL